jgi:hypothetical protein
MLTGRFSSCCFARPIERNRTAALSIVLGRPEGRAGVKAKEAEPSVSCWPPEIQPGPPRWPPAGLINRDKARTLNLISKLNP